MSQKREIFALLVGIDNYPAPVSALQSTHKDVQAFAQYLQNRDDITLSLRILQNKEAQRATIINAILQHLGKAGVGQTALFYFAGHGGREWAHARFAEDSPDGRSEGILCYDSLLPNGKGGGMLLDKELRYLLHQVAKKGAHLLTIFDCCHSGGNTRSQRQQQLRPRQYPPPGSADDTLPAREWEKYLFATARQEASEKTVEVDFPEGTYVQLAACLARQRASEGEQGGLFTQALIRVLTEQKQPLSYRKLLDQIQQTFVQNHDQSPNYYIADKTGRLANAQFLLGMEEQYLFGHAPLRFDKVAGWTVDLGQRHGLQDNSRLFPIWDQQDGRYEAKIGKLGPTSSQLVFPDAPSSDKICAGDFSGALTRPLQLLLQINPEEEQDTYSILQAFAEIPFVNWVQSAAQADYGIQLSEEALSIVKPGEQDALVRPIERRGPHALKLLTDYLQHIARWHQLLHMEDEKGNSSIQISIAQHNERGVAVPCGITADAVSLLYNQRYQGQASGRIDIGLTNNSNQERHVALLYFDPHFMIYSGLLPGDVIALPPGKTYWVKNQRLTLEAEVEKYNWSSSTCWLKVLSANRFFTVSPYQLPDLPGPFALPMRAGRGELKDTQLGIQDQWETYRLRLVMKPKNPESGFEQSPEPRT